MPPPPPQGKITMYITMLDILEEEYDQHQDPRTPIVLLIQQLMHFRRRGSHFPPQSLIYVFFFLPVNFILNN